MIDLLNGLVHAEVQAMVVALETAAAALIGLGVGMVVLVLSHR